MSLDASALDVLHITDCHLSRDKSADLLGINTHDSLMAVLANVDASGISPDYILVTGDIAQDGSLEAYQTLKQALSKFTCPISWFPGNHDDRDNMRKAVGAGHELDKCVKLGAWQFVLLDSLSPGNVHGELSSYELDVLEQSLNADSAHTMVCLHHHPVPIDCTWLDKIGLHNAQPFLDIVDRHEHVKALLWGHIHQEFDQKRKAYRLLATPSTCIQFKPKTVDFALDDRAPGYRWLRLEATGELKTEVLRANDFDYQLDMASNGY